MTGIPHIRGIRLKRQSSIRRGGFRLTCSWAGNPTIEQQSVGVNALRQPNVSKWRRLRPLKIDTRTFPGVLSPFLVVGKKCGGSLGLVTARFDWETPAVIRAERRRTGEPEACIRGGLWHGSRTKTAAPSFMQKDIEQGVVNPNLAVIFDEPQFSEAVHKKTHPGSGCANHLSQYLLADLRNHRLRVAFLAELGEQ